MTFVAIKKSALTQQQRADALQAVMVLKEKRCVKVKGRMCADIHKKHKTSKKLDAISPTVSNESVLITTDIDVSESQDVVIVFVPGALRTIDMDEEVIIIFEGALAKITE